MHPQAGAGVGGGAGTGHESAGGGGAGVGGLGVGSTKMHVFLMIGGGAGSFSTRSMIFGGGFLGCSVILSMICWGARLTTTRSITSPGGVGFLFFSCFTIGGGVGSRTLSTFRLGGETLQSSAGGAPQAGAGVGGFGVGGFGVGALHPQDIFFFDRFYFSLISGWFLVWMVLLKCLRFLAKNSASFIAHRQQTNSLF